LALSASFMARVASVMTSWLAVLGSGAGRSGIGAGAVVGWVEAGLGALGSALESAFASDST